MQPHARYEVLEKIASGSFATVYRGRDLELGRDVAIKQIHEQFLENPKQLERYWQEAQLLASFQHPNIVTIYDIVRERGWLIMELMQGNLARVSGRKPMELGALRTTLAHCLRALKFLHAHGVVHGDIKPSNMMIDRRRRIKIGDFGLARRVSDDDGSLIKGTTRYMAPEVVSDEFGEVGPASDLYSLGFAAFELMCGENFETLFPGLNAHGRDKQIAWMMWHAARDRRLPDIARVLEGVPEDLARTVKKLTQKSQADRYKTADEALSDLNIDLKLVKSGDDSGDDAAPRPTDAGGRKRLVAIAAFSASVLISLAAVFMPSGKTGSLEPAPATAKSASIVFERILDDKHTLVARDDAGVPQEFQLAEKPRIRLNDERYILPRDLQPSDHLEVAVDAAGRIATIQVFRPERSSGKIKAVSAADRELVVTVDDGVKVEDLSLRVPEGAKITLNGESAGLDALTVDDRAAVTQIKDSQGGLPRLAVRIDALRAVESRGFVVSVDAAHRRLVMSPAASPAGQRLTLPVAEACQVKINGDDRDDDTGKSFSLADMKPNDRVLVRRDLEVQAIEATRGVHIVGPLVEVKNAVAPDADGQIVVQTGDRGALSLRVGGECEIMLGGVRVDLNDLRKNDEVEIVFDADDEEPHHVLTLDVARKSQPGLAILIGAQKLADKSATRLPFVTADMQLIRRALTDRYGISSERVVLLQDSGKDKIHETVPHELQRATNVTPVWVYVGGHAYRDDSGRVYVAPADVNRQTLAKSGLALDWLIEQLEKCASENVVLLLDCSHEGTGADLKTEQSTAEMVESLKLGGPLNEVKKTAIIASCDTQEHGKDWPQHQHGLFAWYVAEAFSGKAAKGGERVVDARGLFEYLREKMSQATERDQPVQHPVFFPPP